MVFDSNGFYNLKTRISWYHHPKTSVLYGYHQTTIGYHDIKPVVYHDLPIHTRPDLAAAGVLLQVPRPFSQPWNPMAPWSWEIFNCPSRCRTSDELLVFGLGKSEHRKPSIFEDHGGFPVNIFPTKPLKDLHSWRNLWFSRVERTVGPLFHHLWGIPSFVLGELSQLQAMIVVVQSQSIPCFITIFRYFHHQTSVLGCFFRDFRYFHHHL